MRFLCQRHDIGGILGIKAAIAQRLLTMAAPAGLDADDVKEQSVDAERCVFLTDLAGLGDEQVKVGGVEAQAMIARAGKIVGRGGQPALLIAANDPFGMLVCGVLIVACRDIDGGADADLVGRLDLGGQQLEIPEGGVHFIGFGFMVCPAVVAFGEHGDRIDVADAQGILELLFIKAGADAGNVLAGVEIKVDLTKSHGMSSFLSCNDGDFADISL